MTQSLLASLSSLPVVLLAMAIAALVEAAIPLRSHARERARLGANLGLALVALTTYALLYGALAVALASLRERGFGLLDQLALSAPGEVAATVLALDLSAYAAHVSMHKLPLLWRAHRVHHGDRAVDVTTALRQHPGETLVRFGFTAACAVALGAAPAAFAIYRSASAFGALFEHANIRLPLWLDGFLSLAITSPNLHKVHHSQDVRFTDTNYGNIFSIWDRLARTFTPAHFGTDIVYGLDESASPARTTAAQLAGPFR
jgi:sterol desaturase/sphingolipid hydroxylase (fatty acid hydroxylase superfamily)